LIRITVAHPPASDTSDTDSGLGDVRHGYAPDTGHEHPAQPPLGEIGATLIADIRATVATEMALLQARAALASHGARRAAIWGGIAAAAAIVALLTLCIGMILILLPLVGPLAATLIVVALLLIVAAFGAWRARGGAADIRMAFSQQGSDPHLDDAP
jgi:uncharacterized membrane protein YqjE